LFIEYFSSLIIGLIGGYRQPLRQPKMPERVMRVSRQALSGTRKIPGFWLFFIELLYLYKI